MRACSRARHGLRRYAMSAITLVEGTMMNTAIHSQVASSATRPYVRRIKMSASAAGPIRYPRKYALSRLPDVGTGVPTRATAAVSDAGASSVERAGMRDLGCGRDSPIVVLSTHEW